jgi:hypothetical protein
MTSEWVNNCINELAPKLREYARAYLDYLRGRSPQPDPKEFGLDYNEAQGVRIKLAGLMPPF